MALSGDGMNAKQIMDSLVRENPSDTLLNEVDAPVVLAGLQLQNRQGEQAVRSLESVRPYEFGTHAGLLPTYLRGVAYLQQRKAREAAAEFQSVLDHRGVDVTSPIWETAKLGLARAYVMTGETVKAKAAYNESLALWKDADPDLPVLKEAKAESARLQ